MENTSMTLEDLNQQEALQYTGGVVLVSICMVMGTVRNLHVLYVFWFRTKPSSRRTLTLAMAVLDLITCVVAMPFSIVMQRNPLTYTSTPVCKGYRYWTYILGLSSALFILVIAIDRYKKVCVPLGTQISTRCARNLSISVICISACLSWPALVLYGHSSVTTQNPSITGVRCYISNEYKGSLYLVYFNASLSCLILGVVCTLIALYCRIAKAILKHNKFLSNVSSATSKNDVKLSNSSKYKESDCSDTPDDTEKMMSNVTAVIENRDEEESTGVENDTVYTNNTKTKTELFSVLDHRQHFSSVSTAAANDNNAISGSSNTRRSKRSSVFARTKRTTSMFFIITAVFCITYVLQVVLMTTTFVIKDFISRMSFVQNVSYHTAVWMIYISNITNCFIYGFWDLRFRTEVKRLYGRFLCTK